MKEGVLSKSSDIGCERKLEIDRGGLRVKCDEMVEVNVVDCGALL